MSLDVQTVRQVVLVCNICAARSDSTGIVITLPPGEPPLDDWRVGLYCGRIGAIGGWKVISDQCILCPLHQDRWTKEGQKRSRAVRLARQAGLMV